MLPEDAWWPVRRGAPDGLVRGDDEVHTEVVDGFGEGFVDHLEEVDRGGQHRVWPNHPSLNQERDLEVGEASALADASTLAVHGHAAADDQVHRWQLRGCHLPPGLGCLMRSVLAGRCTSTCHPSQQTTGSSNAHLGMARSGRRSAIAAPLERCAELLGVNLATVRRVAADIEPYVRSDSTKVWSLMQLERQLRPEAYRRVRGGYISRRRAQGTDA
jgi:hypothetical protein